MDLVSDATDFEGDPQRFINVALYVGIVAQGFLMMTTFSIASPYFAVVYKVSLSQVNLMQTVFSATSFLFKIPSALLIDKYGVSKTAKLAATSVLIGAWLRYFILYSELKFMLLLLGQGLVGLGLVFLTSVYSKVSTLWFPKNETFMATTVMGMAPSMGYLMSSLIPPLVKLDETLVDDVAVGKKRIEQFVFFSAIAISCACGPTILGWRAKPRSPPSEAAIIEANRTAESILPQAKKLVKNRNFMKVFMVYMIQVGLISSNVTMIPAILVPFGFVPTKIISQYAGILLLCGLVSSFSIGFFLRKTKKLLASTRVLVLCAILVKVGQLFAIHAHSESALYFLYALAGATVLPMQAVGVMFAVEVAFPVSQAFTCCFVEVFTQLFVFGLVYLGSETTSSSTFYDLVILFVFIALCGVSLLLSLFIKEELNMSNPTEARRDTDNNDEND
jgi:MFS family permease